MRMIPWDSLAKRSEGALAELQNKKIAFLFRHLLCYQPVSKELFAKTSLNARSIVNGEALLSVPESSKQDLLSTEKEPARARAFILQPNEELIRHHAPKSQLLKMLSLKLAGKDPKPRLEWEYKPVHVHFTTGRTAAQIPIVYSRRDLEVLAETGVRMFETIGATKDDIVVNAFPYAPHLAFWLTAYATRASGVLTLDTGGGKIMGTDKILSALTRTKATILIGIPGYVYHLLREAHERKMSLPSLRIVVLGGERVTRGLRTKLDELLNGLGATHARVLATYAFTEGRTAWVQCHPDSGYHLYPDIEYIELLSKDGTRAKEGESGEITYTALDWRGSVVVRYRTGDWSDGIERGPCRYCGRTVPRLKSAIERRSEIKELLLTKVKGELINLNSISAILHDTPEVLEWQIEIAKRNDDPFEVDELRLHVAAKGGVDAKRLTQDVAGRVSREVMVNPVVRVHDLPALLGMLGMESELKEQRIVDRRPTR